MLTAYRIEAFSVPLRRGRARAAKPTHSTMMDPSSVGSASSMIGPSPATPSVASYPNAAIERISACFLREQYQGRKHDRGRGDEGLS
jgi:hypothetical protein